MKENGIAHEIRFSFHDTTDLLKEILDEYGNIFDIVQLELNYLDWKNSVIEAHKDYNLCVDHRLDVYVIEPLKGGVIVNPNDEIKNDLGV